MQFIKRHMTLTALLLLLLVVVAIVVYPVFVGKRGSHIDTCATQLSLLGVAMQAYAADYDSCLPNALTWPANLHPYYQSDRYLHCPEDERPRERSYEMLQRWGDQRIPQGKAERLILLYEIGKYGLDYRHSDGMWIGHGDGHVRWYARDEMTPGTILGAFVPEAAP